MVTGRCVEKGVYFIFILCYVMGRGRSMQAASVVELAMGKKAEDEAWGLEREREREGWSTVAQSVECATGED